MNKNSDLVEAGASSLDRNIRQCKVMGAEFAEGLNAAKGEKAGDSVTRLP